MLVKTLLLTLVLATVQGQDETNECSCEAYDSCQTELADNHETCRQSTECVDLITATNADDIVACYDAKYEAEFEFHACFEREMGKPCEAEPDDSETSRRDRWSHRRGDGRGHRRRGDHSSRSSEFPDYLKDYYRCVRDCVSPDAEEGNQVRFVRGAYGGHHRGRSLKKHCARSLGCPRNRRSRDEYIEAKDVCREEVGSDPRGQLCTCLADAGVEITCE